ncbi:MAG: hypothetical protein C0462_00485 [Alcanivorax sp.]|nr:hypothetical protein [Alcanivorax sp.]
MEAQRKYFPAGMRVYYGRRRFLLIAQSYRMNRIDSPYRRLSATLLLACGEPFELDAGNGASVVATVALIAPGVPRRRTVALDSNLFIFDFPIGTPDCALLQSEFSDGTEVKLLDPGLFADLQSRLWRAAEGVVPCSEVAELFSLVVRAISGKEPASISVDWRIERTLHLVDQLLLNQVDVPELAAQVNLSPSRLRCLFKQEMGCSLGYYARWVALWRAVELWKQGKSITDMAHEAGFYDLAHLDRVYNEILGMSPTALVESDVVTPIRCWS